MAEYRVRLFETATYVAENVVADSEDEAIAIAKELYADGNMLCIESSIDDFVPYVETS